MEFTKPYLSLNDHIELIEKRGLKVPDHDKARRYLQAIGYYRLSAYFLPYQKIKDAYTPETSFESVLSLYIADRKLRLLSMDALERIEVAFKAGISNTMSASHGPHWFLNKKLFRKEYQKAQNGYDGFIRQVDGLTGKNKPANRNTACAHYYNTYTSPPLPPSWVITEVLPMGTWSKIYAELQTKYQKRISLIFGFDKTDLKTWIHLLTLIRNKCAHHDRFWNHTFPATAKNIEDYTYSGIPINSPYTQFAIIQSFLTTFTHDPSWSKKLFALLSDWPLDIHGHMGFPKNWETIQFWNINPNK